MARINIEECWWSDPRRGTLIDRLGKTHLADAAALQAWRTAQGFWARNKLVPWRIFHAVFAADDLIATGLAELCESEEPGSKRIQADSKQSPSEVQGLFVYVRGSSDYLSWVRENRTSGSAGGKKSAQRPRDAKGRLLKKSKRTPSELQATSKPIQASSSSSSSGSLSDSGSGSEFSKDENQENEIPAEPNAGAFIGAYCRLWKERYGARPEIRGVEQGMAKRLTKDIGTHRACSLLAAFLKMDDMWFVTKRHDLATFEANLNAVVQFHDTGVKVSRTQAKGMEAVSHAKSQLERIADGTL